MKDPKKHFAMQAAQRKDEPSTDPFAELTGQKAASASYSYDKKGASYDSQMRKLGGNEYV